MARYKDGWPIPEEWEQQELEINVSFVKKFFSVLIAEGVLPTDARDFMLNEKIPAWKRNEKFSEFWAAFETHIVKLEQQAEINRWSAEVQKRDSVIAEQILSKSAGQRNEIYEGNIHFDTRIKATLANNRINLGLGQKTKTVKEVMSYDSYLSVEKENCFLTDDQLAEWLKDRTEEQAWNAAKKRHRG